MRERDHDNLEYEGGPGEKVRMTITAQGTTHMVNFKLNDDASQVLKKGDPIEFNLKNTSGAKTNLQVNLDGSTRGTYVLVVENVPNCKNDPQHTIGKCIDTRKAPPKKSSLYTFVVA